MAPWHPSTVEILLRLMRKHEHTSPNPDGKYQASEAWDSADDRCAFGGPQIASTDHCDTAGQRDYLCQNSKDATGDFARKASLLIWTNFKLTVCKHKDGKACANKPYKDNQRCPKNDNDARDQVESWRTTTGKRSASGVIRLLAC